MNKSTYLSAAIFITFFEEKKSITSQSSDAALGARARLTGIVGQGII